MSAKQKHEGEEQVLSLASLAKGMQTLWRIVIFLLFVSVATSACLNVYVIRRNTDLETQVQYYKNEAYGLVELRQFVRRLVIELDYVAKDDKAVADVLSKYQQALYQFGLMRQSSSPTPE